MLTGKKNEGVCWMYLFWDMNNEVQGKCKLVLFYYCNELHTPLYSRCEHTNWWANAYCFTV